MTYPKGSKPTICDCPFTDWCEDGRQYLQDIFRNENKNYKVTDCDFFQMIEEKESEKKKMHIQEMNNSMIMSESLVCVNYSDMKHYVERFEKVGDNEYKCKNCGAVLIVKEPVLALDDKDRLKMQIAVEVKQ